MNIENITKLKRVNEVEIEDLVINTAKNMYDQFVSDNIADYANDMRTEFIEDQELKDGKILALYKSHVEFAKVGKSPEVIDWYEIYYFNNKQDYERNNYTKVEYFI